MICKICAINFELFPGEDQAYQIFQTPLPSTCPTCRQRRRSAFRNEKQLYHNKSFLSGRQIIALYPPDSPFRIIDQSEWWDDAYDATIYGKDFDFSRPFFDQFKDLQKEVPRWCRIFLNCENSDFTNNCANTNNSYLAFSCHDCENLYYCVRVNRSKDCMDSYNIAACEYCSNSIDCDNCYNVHYSESSKNCHDSLFLFDCYSCDDCILCAGIRNGQYMILNQKYSKEEYEKYKENFLNNLWKSTKNAYQSLENLKRQIPHRNVFVINGENCSGNFLINSKNLTHCFNVTNSEDCINLYNCDRLKNCYDNYHNDKSELCLECDTSYESYNCKFSTYFVGAKNVQYCDQCFFIENCFGCIGLKREKNMILNKQYDEADYKIMLNRIRAHMQATGEYGKPLPITLSAFAYNETVASETHPLTREEAEKEGFFWHKEVADVKHFGNEFKLPENSHDIDSSVCDKILTCESSGKPYKIIPQEYHFYKKLNLPLPRLCPDQRYKNLLKLRNKETLRETNCSFCNKKIETAYPLETPYKIVCQNCYLKENY